VDLGDWEVALSLSTTIGNESVRTRSPFEDSESMSAQSDSEDGCGELSSTCTPHLSLLPPPDTDDPAAWRFGPSYGSDMIIVAARGISLV